MTQNLKYYAATAALLATIPAAHARSCPETIASVQSQVDSAIEADAVSGGWKPKSLDAQRGYQPTPGTLAASEGRSGLEEALDRLERARSADRAMNVAKCYQEVDRARAAIGE